MAAAAQPEGIPGLGCTSRKVMLSQVMVEKQIESCCFDLRTFKVLTAHVKKYVLQHELYAHNIHMHVYIKYRRNKSFIKHLCFPLAMNPGISYLHLTIFIENEVKIILTDQIDSINCVV